MTKQTPLPLRNDTILGVCEAIGQDFGFNPIFLRLAFIAFLFFEPLNATLAYVGLGLVVAAIRYLVRDTKTGTASLSTPASRPTAIQAQEALPIAA